MKKNFMVITFIGLGVLSLWSANKTFASEKAVNLEFISSMTATDKITILFQEWGKEVEKKTGGSIVVAGHPVGTLVPPPQAYDAVVKGIADIAWAPLAFSPGRFPLSEFLDLPLGLSNNRVSSLMANEYFMKFKPEELDDVKMFFFALSPPYYIHTKKSVETMDDLKGMKIKITGSAHVDVMKALGLSLWLCPWVRCTTASTRVS